MSQAMVVKAVWAIAVAFFVVFGVWAFVSPASFHDEVALFDPYNGHFLRDAGAFQLGIGAALIAGMTRKDGLFVALVGASAASVLHALSHVIDADRGGRASDHLFLWTLAAVLTVATVLEGRKEKR